MDLDQLATRKREQVVGYGFGSKHVVVIDAAAATDNTVPASISANVYKRDLYYSDWESGTSGIVKKSGVRDERNDFAMRITAFVEAGNNTGYLATVRREFDRKSRECFFTSSSVHRREKFMDMVNNSFGSGGMTCGLDPTVLPHFIQYLKRQHKELPKKKAVLCPGKQDNGLYFLTKDITIDEDGQLVSSAMTSRSYAWIKRELVSESDKLLVSDILPCIRLPISSLCLRDMFDDIKPCLKHNLIPALMMISGGVMCFHYAQVVATYGGCCMVVASGEPATGKSCSIQLALSTSGVSNNNLFVKGSNRTMLERSSLSTLPYGIDDLCSGKKAKNKPNQLDIEELAVNLYNGLPTTNYNSLPGTLKPLSIPLVASNLNSVTETRACRRILEVKFSTPTVGPRNSLELDAYQKLSEDLKSNRFSSAIGWVIAQGKYLKGQGGERVKQLQKELQFKMNGTTVMQSNMCGWCICLTILEQMLLEIEFPGNHGTRQSDHSGLDEESDQMDTNSDSSEDSEFNYRNLTTKLMEQAKIYVIDILKSKASASEPLTNDPTSTVFQFCVSLCSAASEMARHEILTFMRGNTTVGGRPVIAIWTSKAVKAVPTINAQMLNNAVRESGLGKTQEKRDFLRSGCTDREIIRNVNDIRQSCIALFTDDPRWPADLLRRFKRVLSSECSRDATSTARVSNQMQCPVEDGGGSSGPVSLSIEGSHAATGTLRVKEEVASPRSRKQSPEDPESPTEDVRSSETALSEKGSQCSRDAFLTLRESVINEGPQFQLRLSPESPTDCDEGSGVFPVQSSLGVTCTSEKQSPLHFRSLCMENGRGSSVLSSEGSHVVTSSVRVNKKLISLQSRMQSPLESPMGDGVRNLGTKDRVKTDPEGANKRLKRSFLQLYGHRPNTVLKKTKYLVHDQQ